MPENMLDVIVTQEHFPLVELVYWGLFFTLTSTRMIYAGNKSISINTYVAAVITLRESEAGEFSAKH